MKRKLRRMASFCMTVVLLLSSVVWAPAAGVEGETISLAEADIHIEDVCYYNGSRQTPKMTVTLHTKVLTEKSDYTVTYQNNVNAGTATVTVTGEGIYSGSASTLFTIHPRKVDAEELSIERCMKEYDGTTQAKPEIRFDGTVTGDIVTVTYESAEYATPYVGSQIPITASGIGFAGPDGKNYVLEDETLVLADENGIINAVLPDVEDKVELAVNQTMDLQSLISNDWRGHVTFSMATYSGGNEPSSTLSDSILKAGKEEENVYINLQFEEYNVDGKGRAEYSFGSNIKQILIEIVDQEKQEELTLLVENQPSVAELGTATIYYGQALQFDVQGGSGTGAVTYKVENSNNMGQAEIDQSGLLSTKEVGTVRVQAQKAGDDRYEGGKWSDPVIVTILPAPLTIQVKDKTARIGDAIPTLTAADYTVTGLVGADTLAQAPSLTYVSTPDMSKTGAVAIQASGAGIPNGNYDPNITYLPGVLTIQETPTYTITVPTVEHGTITADKAAAQEGDTVTLTVKLAEKYLLETLTVTTDAAAPGTVAVKEMGEGIYTFTMPAGNVIVSGTMVPEEATPEWPPFPFTDVPESLWYYDSVYYVYAYGLMNGTATTLFSPGNPTTRGMLVTILYRIEGSPQGAGWGPFTDVTPGAYYAQPIAWAAWNGIVNGITSTTFAPDRNVTREQMAAILYRYTAWKGWDVSQQGNLFQFTDWQKVQTYARTPLAWAVASGLIQGKENQRLDPGGPATRAEVATILQRFHSTYVAPPAEEETA